MFFRIRYGSKASIRVEPLTLNHINTYTPSLVNMNCTIHEIDYDSMTHEPTTSLAKVLDYLLDEWATKFLFD